MPASWAAASPAPIVRNIATISRRVRGRSASQPRSVVPGTYSIATNTPPSSAPTSNTVTTLGCASRAIAIASRRSRSTSRPRRWRLIATSRSSVTSRAR
jgi:hypothetical protein